MFKFEDPMPRCSIGKLLYDLQGSESEALAYMLDADLDEWPHADIHRALADENISASFQQIGTHRRKQCGCSNES